MILSSQYEAHEGGDQKAQEESSEVGIDIHPSQMQLREDLADNKGQCHKGSRKKKKH